MTRIGATYLTGCDGCGYQANCFWMEDVGAHWCEDCCQKFEPYIAEYGENLVD